MSRILLIVCLALCCTTTFVTGRSQIWWHTSAKVHHQVSYSSELIEDLKDFLDLIPTADIDVLVAEHSIFDSGFRHAAEFLRSSEFKELAQSAEQLPEVIEVINFLHLHDKSIRKLLHFHNRHNPQLIIEGAAVKEYAYFVSNGLSQKSLEEGVVVVFLPESQNTIETPAGLGSFASFTQDLLTHLPRDRFVALITEKLNTGTVFPKFYAALRSDEFKQLVEKTMKSPNVENILQTLASHDIDANALKEIAFEVISWGPEVKFIKNKLLQ
ncbi:uncharacterized protein LOC117566569 [Drosophila albomicans]|uniref:Uncharacterized protein LOC117566569 n=1 Tax=Drosophila albomicans TaxID=7291 RepID=A0A6P8XX71_DROAB|nr:uncharacterized protein LOC117566569 [Drosophila albomicans]